MPCTNCYQNKGCLMLMFSVSMRKQMCPILLDNPTVTQPAKQTIVTSRVKSELNFFLQQHIQ